MTRTTAWALAALLASGLAAQDAAPQSAAAKEAYQKLVDDYASARAKFDAAFKALRESAEWKKAQEAEDNEAMRELYQGLEAVDASAFGERALDLAGQFTGDEAVPFLTWATTNTRDKDIQRDALAQIRDNHLESAAILPLVEQGYVIGRALGNDEGTMMLDLLIGENPHKLVKAWSLYWKAMPLQRGRGSTAEDKAKADELMAQAEKLAVGTELADKIAAPRFERENLQIGMVAPDIEGVDTDGTKFKLSDYRGKVVVLDFWGFW